MSVADWRARIAADLRLAINSGYGVEDVRVRFRLTYEKIAEVLEAPEHAAHRRIALRYAAEQRRRSAA